MPKPRPDITKHGPDPLLVMVTRRQWAMAAVCYGAVTVKCAVTGVAPEALTVTVAWYTPAVA